MRTQPAGKELGFDNPWLALPFLCLYGFPWLFQPPTSRDLMVAAVALAAFMALFVLGHRNDARHGLICAFGMTLLGVATVPMTVTAAVFFIFAAALIGRSPPRHMALSALGVLIAAVIATGFWQQVVLWQWAPVVFLCAMIGYYSHVSASLHGRNQQLILSRMEAERVAAQAERDRMTRDLHDLLGRSLTLISVKAELVERMIDRDPARAGKEIADIRASAREALQEVRQVVSDAKRLSLSAEIGRSQSLLATLGVSCEVPDTVPDLPQDIDETLAFIVREAVTNIVRHAGPCEAAIALTQNNGAVRLTVRDSGKGKPGQEGNGMSGMRTRAEAIGGQFLVTHDKGTRIDVTVPIEGKMS